MTNPASAFNKMADANMIEALDAALPAIMMDARRAASSIVMGEHGKRRAGLGDAFWQHREWTNGESIRQVDWRRSARSDKLFVRERERQVPALLQVWCDNRVGMEWTSDVQIPTKAQRGLVMGLALAIATRAGGERVCALGLGTPLSNELAFARLLTQAGKEVPRQFQAGQVLLMSDGLESAEIWTQRAKQIGAARAQLIVVLIADRAEQDFPYQGRIAFSATAVDAPLIIGRAQAAQAEYVAAYRQHLNEVQQAIVRCGGQVFTHNTTEPAVPTLLRLAAALDRAAPRSRVA
jgi:uncharacterized protein (DUF58 family)